MKKLFKLLSLLIMILVPSVAFGNVIDKHNYRHNVNSLNIDNLDESIERTIIQARKVSEDFPILNPLCSIKLLAIAPTIIMLSNFGIKFFITEILVDILDPPIIQVIGFLISEVTFFKAFISISNCKPTKEGRNLVISHKEA